MKLFSLVLTCAAIALISIACGATTTTTNTATPPQTASPASPAPASSAVPGDEFAAARANYAKHCESCHGPNAEGGPVKTPEKQIKVPSLKAPHAVRHTDDQLVKMITNGEEDMPSFKEKLKPEEITEMVRFVRKNFQGK
ncbi:MAG TPA: cytochrome c [Pyrinomonadaceae bacterium]|nr:cytochrome c [Pyrinomonadaceae bacterium]